MRKISYYIIAVVALGVAVVSFWVYLRYFKTTDQSFLYFKVERGDIQESIKVRSEVVAQKEVELEFPFSGTVESVYVHEGDLVSPGQQLMKLETKDFEIEAQQLQSVVAQRKADLTKLQTGASPEEIKVSESKLASAQVAVAGAEKSLVDKIKDAYTISDDAIRAKTDQLFDNPRGSTPALNIPTDSQTKTNLNFQRLTLESVLNNWNASLANLSATTSNLSDYTNTAKKNLSAISDFLNILSPSVNNLIASASLSQVTIDSYKTSVSSGRANINLAITNLVAAEEKLKLAEADVELSQSELNLKLATARSEDVTIAEARVNESQSALDAINEKIRRSTLNSPISGKISKIHYEIGEIFRPGQSAVSEAATSFKLQADVSELDIAKVHESENSNVRVELDAFPGQSFEGRVTSIDAQEIIKTEDKYYRVNIVFDAPQIEVRSGMSADATIFSTKKTNVLKVSELAIYTDEKDKYVKVLLPGLTKADSEQSYKKVPVLTGITDGAYVEILNGLQEGQVAVVSAE